MIPTLSVIIPVYNVEKYLEKCLSSVEHQSFANFEAIIVNDGSSDSSSKIAQTFVDRDGRFRLINQPNGGLGCARNTGIRSAKGKYLFLLDSDDYIKADAFLHLINQCESSGLDILVFNYERVDEEGGLISSTSFGDGLVSKDEAFRRVLSLTISPVAWNKLYKTELFRNADIEYPENALHEDIPVTYRLFWAADKIGYVADSYYCYLVRPGSITQNFSYKHINDVTSALLSIKHFLLENSIFSAYQIEYTECCVKMYSLLLKRSLEHRMLGCMDYLLFVIDSGALVSDHEVNRLEQSETGFVSVYRKNYAWAKSRSTKYLDRYAKKTQERRTYLSTVVTKFKLRQMQRYVYRISYLLMPLGSNRRSLLKKLVGR